VALDDIPFGLWRDEARHGLVALHILANPAYRPVYVPEVDIPALLFYLQTASIALLGPTAGAVRAVPALAGGLTALAIAHLGRTIAGRAVGVVAAALLALAAWHIALSRLAFAAVLDPPLSLLALALLWHIGDAAPGGWRRLLAGAGAGAALGLALYTYHPARLMPLAAALWLALRLGRSRAAWRRALPALAACALAAALVAGPLLAYWLTQSRDFNQRVGQVSLLDSQSGKRALSADLNRNVELYALMWHVAGDQNARHNIPGTPMLDPLSGLLFLVGLLLLLADRRAAAMRPLLALLAVGLLPGLLSNSAPHTVRSVDAIAPALLIAAYAAARIAPALARQPAALRIGAPAAALALLAAINIWGYFGRVPYDPRVWDAFTYTADTAIGRAIQGGACAGQAMAPTQIAQGDVMDYTAYGHTVAPFSLDAPPARFPPGACVFVPADLPAAQRAALDRALGGVTPQPGGRYPGTSQPVFLMYRVP
jgi:4-amino-4-deoxy-L-arabinose transferase-like glycosyltransferase